MRTTFAACSGDGRGDLVHAAAANASSNAERRVTARAPVKAAIPVGPAVSPQLVVRGRRAGGQKGIAWGTVCSKRFTIPSPMISFPGTRHSIVAAIRSDRAEVRRSAFDALAGAYWKPVFK